MGQSWILAVGDEILSGHTADTNSAWLAGRLATTAHPCARIVVAPDDEAAVAEELQRARATPGVDRVFCCGGLGPTPDDRTLAAVARALGLPLREDPQALAHVRHVVERMHAAGWVPDATINAGNRRMTRTPAGSIVLRNRTGMAPALAIPLAAAEDDAWLLVLPGVPRELRTVVDEEILPVYCAGGAAVTYRELHYTGVGESSFFEALGRLARTYPQVRFGSYPQPTAGDLVIRASGLDPAQVARALSALSRMRPGGRPAAGGG
ncbi:MAG TPA: molybdopterin-binding protein [Candidatus Dormibacteraeota bacterium]|nr:molybdopterin-binding protein [Candidatus Dormibacteraeota bacterium]